MIRFTTTIHKFEKQGEKTGWTYIEIPADLADTLNPGVRTSYRVKGKLDKHAIAGVALVPMGGGRFIIALNATLRKAIRKDKGAMLDVQLEVDKKKYELNKDFLNCLEDEPAALKVFQAMPPSHQNYYSKWIESAKTEPTRVKRIAMAVSALARKMDFGEMLRSQSKEN